MDQAVEGIADVSEIYKTLTVLSEAEDVASSATLDDALALLQVVQSSEQFWGGLESMLLGESAGDSLSGLLQYDRAVAPIDSSDTIVVTGTKYPRSGGGTGNGDGYDTRQEDEGGGGGDEGTDSNPPELSYLSVFDCADSTAVDIAAVIRSQIASVGQYEFGALISMNSNGSFGAADGGIHTDYSASFVAVGAEGPYNSAFGLIHNHVWDAERLFLNFEHRYPSDEDWAALDHIAANGADPHNLSIWIVDPWGAVREFSYSQKSYFLGLSALERQKDVGLPAEARGCS